MTILRTDLPIQKRGSADKSALRVIGTLVALKRFCETGNRREPLATSSIHRGALGSINRMPV